MGVEEWGGREEERERKKEYEGQGRAITSVLVLLCSLARTSCCSEYDKGFVI